MFKQNYTPLKPTLVVPVCCAAPLLAPGEPHQGPGLHVLLHTADDEMHFALRLCAANWDTSMALLAAAAAPAPIQFSWLISGEDRRDITDGQTVATWPRTRRVSDIGGYKTFCQILLFISDSCFEI